MHERDANASRIARGLGWQVVRLWECEVGEHPSLCVRRILDSEMVGGHGRIPGAESLK